nr:integrase, catalytic region, zinc finger, CCHC-type, peptidase aspartic, catalytic [Tanacetum cinerariifolium]
LLEKHDPPVVHDSEETLQLVRKSRDKMKQMNKEIKPANYTKINHLSGVFVPQTALSHKELYFSNNSKTSNVSKSFSIPNEDLSDDTTPSVARKFLNEEATKFVVDFKSLANEADTSLAKQKALELDIERLLKAVVSQDVMNIVQNESVVDTSDLQIELERTKECFENCIIKKETEYAKLWNDWYKKCDECKYDKISYDKAYKDMQQKIEWLQAQLGDLKGKSKDTSYVSDTRNLLSQKLKNENVELEFQVLNYARENVHLKATYKNLFDSISASHAQTKTIIASLQNELQSKIYKNAKLRTQLFKKVSDQKDNTQNTSANTKFAKQPIVEHLPKVGKTNALSKPVTSNSKSVNNDKKCLISVNHDKCLSKHVNGKNSCGKNEKVKVSVKEIQKTYQPKVAKLKKVRTRESLATPKPRKPRFLLRWSPTGKLFNQEGKLVDSSESKSKSNGDNACTSNVLEPKIKRFPNSTYLLDSINGKRYVLVIVDDNSRYTWVHFIRSKDEAPEVIIMFLKRISVLLQSPVIIIRTNNDTKFKNQVLKEYFDTVGISHQMSSVRTPQQNGVVELQNRTLVETARTMLIFSRVPLFLWAEAIATVCFTQNRSIIHRRFNKTPYKLINGRKPDISFLHVFGALCYPKNDREDIGKLGAKGNICFFIGYSTDSCAYRVFNRRTKKIMETINVSFDELSAMAFKQRSSKPGLNSMTSGHISSGLDLTYALSTITTQQPSEGELDVLFEALYDDYFGGQPSATVRTVPPAQEPQVRQSSTASTTIADTTPIPTNSSSHATNILITSQDVDELNPNAMVDSNTFVNPFVNSSTSAAAASSSQN